MHGTATVIAGAHFNGPAIEIAGATQSMEDTVNGTAIDIAGAQHPMQQRLKSLGRKNQGKSD